MPISIEQPKGAMTKTARGSKWCFCLSVGLLLLTALGFLLDDDETSFLLSVLFWLRIVGLGALTLAAVLFFRSWRVLKRVEAHQ